MVLLHGAPKLLGVVATEARVAAQDDRIIRMDILNHCSPIWLCSDKLHVGRILEYAMAYRQGHLGRDVCKVLSFAWFWSLITQNLVYDMSSGPEGTSNAHIELVFVP